MKDDALHSALPPAPNPMPRDLGALFHHLAGLLTLEGAHIAYGHPVHGDADWHADTKTLTLRDNADPDEHTWALSEFCRRWHLGEDYSHFIDTAPPRHLQVVT